MSGENREQHSHEAAQEHAHSHEHTHTHEHTHAHAHDHAHSHAHGHVHDDEGPAHIHSHRNIIGFDKHGVPTVVVKADHQDEQDENEFIREYMNAVAEYKKTFPSKQDVIDNTPDPAVREMLLRAEQLGFDTTFDRFDKQKPQCSFGLAGICCKICNMGPCKITPKSPKGICGADADLIVARNLLRSAAAGAAQHGMHGREVILSLKWAAEGKLDLPILGQQKIRDTAKAFGIKTERRSIKRIASELADKLLADMSRTVPDDYEVIKACAPAERQKVWKDLDIIPISAYHEVFEAYHKSGIRFDGICCSGLSAMYRYAGVIPLSNAVSAELVLGTGALDLWIADVQDVFPSIMEVAKCFQTTVITTSESARLPGAERFEYDHRHSNIGETRELAERIVKRAIESFENRKGVPVYIPPYEVDAEVGFSVEYVHKRFGSMAPLAEAVKSGEILGIVNMVGCNNPKVLYEKTALDVADILLQNNILILTNGCVSFPLMKMGYCNMKDGLPKAGESLRNFLSPDLPPVWHVGECIDNTRSSGIFAGIANEFGKDLKDMPFAFTSPEWSNEKGIDASLGFRLMGINSYHCVIEFLKEGTRETLGSVMHVDTDPKALAEKLVEDIKAKRRALGWVVPGEKRKAVAP